VTDLTYEEMQQQMWLAQRAELDLRKQLAAAERVVEAARDVAEPYLIHGGMADDIAVVVEAIAVYDAAVPARGEGRAPEGGSTPPAAILTIRYRV
jgi:hypothetical protein